jgi:hypothetical protein
MSLVGDLNAEITRFVSDERNARLRAGTGGYSTPFRGQLFGKRRASEVDAELAKGRTVDVLFLGANPNCPESLKAISGERDDSDWADFERQAGSDEFGHLAATEDRRWDPLHDPESLGRGQRASWAFYTDCLRDAAGGLDAVALANVLPWGSADVDALVRAARAADPGLPDRIAAFAEGQLTRMITTLRPKVVVCPKSVASKPWARALCVSTSRVSPPRNVGPTEVAGRGYRFLRAEMTGAFHGLPILFIDHPSALRYVKAEHRPRIGDALRAGLRDALREAAG